MATSHRAEACRVQISDVFSLQVATGRLRDLQLRWQRENQLSVTQLALWTDLFARCIKSLAVTGQAALRQPLRCTNERRALPPVAPWIEV